MHRFFGIVVLSLAAALILAGNAKAQTKIATINVQKALLDTADMKKAQAALEAKFKPRQEAMNKLQRELEEIQKQLQLGDKLTPQAQADLQIQGQRKQRELQRLGEDLQADVERERNEILAKGSQQMQDIINKLAEAKGVDVVIGANALLYTKPAIDLTAEATQGYDKAYPVK